MARKDIAMSDTEAADFLAGGHTIIVTSLGPDGWPHVAPMWYVVEDGKVVFRSFTKSQKIVNLSRDDRITVLLEQGELYPELRGVMIRGRARLVADPDYVLAVYGQMSGKYAFAGTQPVPLEGEALEQAFGRFAPKNTAVVVDPVRLISWDHRKLGGAY